MTIQETEPNNTILTANLATVGETLQGSMNTGTDQDFFTVHYASGGQLDLVFTHPNGPGTSGGNIRLQLQDASGSVIATQDFTGNGTLRTTVPGSGYYYVTVIDNNGNNSTFTPGIYSVATSSLIINSASAYDGAVNDTIATAIGTVADGVTTLTAGGVITGSMGNGTDNDYFKVHCTSGGQLDLVFTHPNGPGTSGGNIRLQLQDASGSVITTQDFTGSGTLQATVPGLGDYYVTVIDNNGSNSTFTPGIYSVATSSLIINSASAYDGADNNTIATAIGTLADSTTTLAPGGTITGCLGENNDQDYFKVQSSAGGGQLKLAFTHPNGPGTSGGTIYVQVWDGTNSLIISKSFKGDGTLQATVPGNGECYVAVVEADTSFPRGIYSIALEPSTPAPLSKAKVYLGVDDTFTVSSSGTTVYGNSGTDTVTIASGTTNVVLDQNVERINFPGAGGSYTFKQTGNQINVYDSTGTTLLAKTPVQGDADGTMLSFAGSTYSALMQAGGVMKLGTSTVSTAGPTALLPSAQTVAFATAGTGNADASAPPHHAPDGQSVPITLTGLPSTQGNAATHAADFHTLFG